MITIVNIGPRNDPDPMGKRTYEVRINNKHIATFTHTRSDGLARCLLEASTAVAALDRKNRDNLVRMICED